MAERHGANGALDRVSETGAVPVSRVRAAVHDDVTAITACYLQSWRAAYASDLEAELLDAAAETRRSFDWTRGIDADDATVLVAARDDDIVGVVQADLAPPSPRDLPEITMLYVDPTVWGIGVASALLNAATDWMKEHGVSAARLRVVEAHARARRFYEREGWTIDDDMPPATNDVFRLIYYRRSMPD